MAHTEGTKPPQCQTRASRNTQEKAARQFKIKRLVTDPPSKLKPPLIMKNPTMTSLMDGPLHQNILCKFIIQIGKLPLFRGETEFWDLFFEHKCIFCMTPIPPGDVR